MMRVEGITDTSRHSTGEVRKPLGIPLILFTLVCWAWITVMAYDMYGPMTGASAWTMTLRWDAAHVFLLWAMWAAMMAAMMLPSASPMLLLYDGAAKRQAVDARASADREVYALAAGYMAVWALFSIGATAMQRILTLLMMMSPMMAVTSPVAAATMLVIAGAYQLTPLKRACLRACQSPLGFMMGHWRPGVAGAFRMGIDHGIYCLRCCWALMLLLFVGGVMNLAVIATLAVVVAFEKISPFGAASARIGGVLLMLAAIWILVR
jgi:predicted metal-binding membrane protein